MASKSRILSLYKLLMRESQKFSNYNFRSYALRRVRDAFKEHKELTDPKMIQKEIEYAKENLAVIRRQGMVNLSGHKTVEFSLASAMKENIQTPGHRLRLEYHEAAIGDMYRSEKLVIENRT